MGKPNRPPGNAEPRRTAQMTKAQKQALALEQLRLRQEEERRAAAPAPIQLALERALRVLAVALGLSQMQIFCRALTMFQLPARAWADCAAYALGALFVLGALFYLALTAIRYPKTLARLRRFLRRLLRPEYLLMAGLLVWYVVSCAANSLRQKDDWFTDNLPYLFDVAVSVLVMLPLAALFSGHRARRALNGVIHYLSIVTAASCLLVIVLLLAGEAGKTALPTVFMTNGRRLYMNNNANLVAAQMTLCIALGLIMLVTQRRAAVRALYALAVVAEYIILALTDSQTSLVATGLGAGVVAMALGWRVTRGRSQWLRFTVGLAALAAVSAAVFFGRDLVFAVARQMISGLKNPQARTSLADDNNVVARVQVWLTALRALRSNAFLFFFGSTPVGVTSVISFFSDGKYNMYTHNQFCEIGVSLGVPALLLYTVWLVRLARHCTRTGLAPQGRVPLRVRLLPAVLLALVVGNLMEARLLFFSYFTYTGTFFFLLAGYAIEDSAALSKR